MAIIRLIRRIPSELITVPVEKYVELEQAIETIEQNLALLSREQYKFQISAVAGTDKSAVQVIYHVLEECSDAFPASSNVNLAFIGDSNIRENVSFEIGAVESAFRNSRWTAATVLAGGAIESLLLWRVTQFSKIEIEGSITVLRTGGRLKNKPGDDIREWHLPELIEVAAQLKVLEERTSIEARQSKDFRNLIHPGRVLRYGMRCSRGTACASLAALDFVVEDIAKSVALSSGVPIC